MVLRTLVFGVVLGLLGCASRSENITAAYVSPIIYDNLNCDQLSLEAQRISAEATKLSGAQDKNRTRDTVRTTVGVIIFWPILLFNEGDGQTAAQLGQMKGHMQAIEQASIRKKCRFQFQKAKKAQKETS